MVFNIAIALALMEMNVFSALGQVLGLYANVAIAWMMAVVADLVVNKPLGLSPKGIEFKRAHLYDVNPVGVGAMGIASLLSVVAHLGAFGPLAQAFSAAIALVTAFVAAPLIAWATKGRYYLARPALPFAVEGLDSPMRVVPIVPVGPPSSVAALVPAAPAADAGAYRRLLRCVICERDYEGEDMAHCPAYQGSICSLCCTLDARCDDLCKPHARISAQWSAALRRLLPARMAPQLDAGLASYLLLMGAVVPVLALLCGAVYVLALRALDDEALALEPLLRQGLLHIGALLLLLAGIACWWLVLAHQSRRVAQEESNRQTRALLQEIESHRRTDAQLQQAKAQADAANQAKSRYVTAISHELRSPLNGILGYAQLLEDDPALPAHRHEAVQVIRRGGEHLLGLIEGTLDIARIEAGKLRLEPRPLRLRALLDELTGLFAAQAAAKGLAFRVEGAAALPALVRADEQRLRQILINLLGNAVKFTRAGGVTLRAAHTREMARFEIEDSGPGMDAAEVQRIFEPFERGSAAGGNATGGSGLGLTIARMLATLMGGELTVASTPGRGTTFTLRLFLPALRESALPAAVARPLTPTGYRGARRRLLVVDNEETDRRLVTERLQPLGFTLLQAATGEEALALLTHEPVDAVFMDLAMPGIDGWQAIRGLREMGLVHTPVAIVSANAFDKGLDNELGIGRDDFLVKPVRREQLLAWLGARLALQWIEAPADAEAPLPAPQTLPAVAPPAPLVLPPPPHLQALHEAVRLGWLRGITQRLDAIEAEHRECAGFVAHMRQLARRFQLDTMNGLLREALP